MLFIRNRGTYKSIKLKFCIIRSHDVTPSFQPRSTASTKVSLTKGYVNKWNIKCSATYLFFQKFTSVTQIWIHKVLFVYLFGITDSVGAHFLSLSLTQNILLFSSRHWNVWVVYSVKLRVLFWGELQNFWNEKIIWFSSSTIMTWCCKLYRYAPKYTQNVILTSIERYGRCIDLKTRLTPKFIVVLKNTYNKRILYNF